MKLASIEVIKSIKNHTNADSLELCEILGWQTVVKKGIHKEGDKVVFITIDTIVPRCEWSEFLVDQKNPDKPIRLKNIKLRGEYSSGLVIPMVEFPLQFETLDVGDDITEILGIQKYIKEIPANLSGETLSDFPTHLASKTDEDNGLNDPTLVEKVLNHDSHITVTQKLDGCLIGSTIIKTSEGDFTIQEIVDNKLNLKILSYDIANNIYEYQPILNWFDHGNTEDWLEIEDETGNKITVTPNHKIWLPELNCYRQASDLKINDKILLKN